MSAISFTIKKIFGVVIHSNLKDYKLTIKSQTNAFCFKIRSQQTLNPSIKFSITLFKISISEKESQARRFLVSKVKYEKKRTYPNTSSGVLTRLKQHSNITSHLPHHHLSLVPQKLYPSHRQFRRRLAVISQKSTYLE